MASNATTLGTYLKMPMAGYRQMYDANVDVVGEGGNYWSSTSNGAGYAYALEFDLYGVYPQGYNGRTQGFSVRCFKDTPTIPTSSWTTLYDGSSVATGA